MTNQPATIDADAFTVRRSIRIAAPTEKVWAAITEPEHISAWFGHTELSGSTVGSTGFYSGGGRQLPTRIDAVDAPHSITFVWVNDDAVSSSSLELDDALATTFTFTLEPDADGTLLTVVESGFDRTSDAGSNMESHRDGWTIQLDKLVAYVEGLA